MIFYEWDYNKNTVTQFERDGHCNQCGKCCGGTIMWKALFPIDTEEPRNGSITTDAQGIWCEVVDGEKRRFYQKPQIYENGRVCSELIDGKCAIHAIKHQMSNDWPFHPSQTDMPFSQCSYRFVRLGQWKIDEIEGTANERIKKTTPRDSAITEQDG